MKENKNDVIEIEKLKEDAFINLVTYMLYGLLFTIIPSWFVPTFMLANITYDLLIRCRSFCMWVSDNRKHHSWIDFHFF